MITSWTVLSAFLSVNAIIAFLYIPAMNRRRRHELAVSIAAAVESRAPITTENHLQCSEISAKIARKLGLKRQEVIQLQLSALLHNIGQSAVPIAILRNTSPWHHEDEALFSRHPELGAAILSQIPSLAQCSSAVQFHRARFDTVKEAPIESRIIGTVSEYLRLSRVLSPERAMLAVEKESGMQFDPQVVNALKIVQSH